MRIHDLEIKLIELETREAELRGKIAEQMAEFKQRMFADPDSDAMLRRLGPIVNAGVQQPFEPWEFYATRAELKEYADLLRECVKLSQQMADIAREAASILQRG